MRKGVLLLMYVVMMNFSESNKFITKAIMKLQWCDWWGGLLAGGFLLNTSML